MSLEDLGIIGYKEQTLLIDGDIIIYKPCCIFNEDDDHSRKMIAKTIDQQIDRLMKAAECDAYIMFVTTKFNFRDDLVGDYKANRDPDDRPLNLTWAKRNSMEVHNCHFHKGLEADDLLGIHMSEDTVLWSIDKDLRQVPGRHLDDASQEVITVSEEGSVKINKVNGKDKIYFDGTLGLHYQLLIGDSTDHILGCAKRVPTIWKSGKKKGQEYLKREGVGPKAAIKILDKAGGDTELSLHYVILEYKRVHGDEWQEHLETQANLLYMVRYQDGDIIQRWTYDGREEYFNLAEGKITYDYTPTTN